MLHFWKSWKVIIFSKVERSSLALTDRRIKMKIKENGQK